MPNVEFSNGHAVLVSIVSMVLACTWIPTPAYADCPRKQNRCGKEWAFCPDWPELTPLTGDGCSNIQAGCPRPSHCPVPEKSSCGEHWTVWSDLGNPVNNPCPAGCVPTDRVGHDSRNANEFFAVQYRERWACAGTPPSKGRITYK